MRHSTLHIHLPEGAVPKDGPSAGNYGYRTASAYTGRKVRGDTKQTGEITLTGEVLPSGGTSKGKLLPASSGSSRILPKRTNVTSELKIHPRSAPFRLRQNVDEVLSNMRW